MDRASGYERQFREVREWIESAAAIAVLTGAGVSAETGIPTFRGPGGLWRNFRAEDLATPEAFARDPKLVWEWYDWRRGIIAAAQPNAAHFALAEIEARAKHFTLITQNVDGLHDRAGSRRILKVHGDIWILRCARCGRQREDRRASLFTCGAERAAPIEEIPPRCACGGFERPGVVWFGEPLPRDVWRDAEIAARSAEIFLVIGTAAAVYPAAGLIALAKSSGAKVVEINIAETPYTSSVDISLRGPAAEILPRVVSSTSVAKKSA